jgi:hypothetical protein
MSRETKKSMNPLSPTIICPASKPSHSAQPDRPVRAMRGGVLKAFALAPWQNDHLEFIPQGIEGDFCSGLGHIETRHRAEHRVKAWDSVVCAFDAGEARLLRWIASAARIIVLSNALSQSYIEDAASPVLRKFEPEAEPDQVVTYPRDVSKQADR